MTRNKFESMGRLAYYEEKDQITSLHGMTGVEQDLWMIGWNAAEHEYQAVRRECDDDPRKRRAWGSQMARRLREEGA